MDKIKKYIIEEYGTGMFYTEEDNEDWTASRELAGTFTEEQKDMIIRNLEPIGYACFAHEV